MSRATETATITLGGQDYPVRAFTLDQLQDLTDVLPRIALPANQGGFEAMRTVIRTAIGDEAASQARASYPEVVEATKVLARIAGLTVGDAAQGEAKPGAPGP